MNDFELPQANWTVSVDPPTSDGGPYLVTFGVTRGAMAERRPGNLPARVSPQFPEAVVAVERLPHGFAVYFTTHPTDPLIPQVAFADRAIEEVRRCLEQHA